MDMIFYYGGKTFDANSVNFAAINRSFARGSTQRPHILHVSWSLRGKIVRTNQADVWTEYNAIVNALQNNDGGTSAGFQNTPYVMGGSTAIGGIAVTNAVSHEGLGGAEGITYLKYTFGLDSDYIWSAANDPLAFHEQISFSDNSGLPKTIERLPLFGPPIRQVVSQTSWYYATQTGSLEQSGPNPVPMAPIFGIESLRTSGDNGQSIVRTSPQMVRGTPIKYGVNWTYQFVSPNPLVGSPNAIG